MAVNFLATVTTKDIKQEQSKTNFIMWNVGILVVFIVVGAIILLIEGYFQSQIVTNEANITTAKQDLASIQEVHDHYYTLSYKLRAIQIIKNQNYLPTIITDYIESKAPAGVTISSYRFLEDGGFEVSVEAQDFKTGVTFWDSLLTDKDKIRTLNLKGMSRDTSNRANQFNQKVSFTLSGAVFVDKLNQPLANGGSN